MSPRHLSPTSDAADARATEPLKVWASTKERVRLGAAMEGCTQSEFVTRAVDRFIEAHRDEFVAATEEAKKVLGV